MMDTVRFTDHDVVVIAIVSSSIALVRFSCFDGS